MQEYFTTEQNWTPDLIPWRRKKPSKISFTDRIEKHFEFCSGRQSTLLNHSRAKLCQQLKQQQQDVFHNIFRQMFIFYLELPPSCKTINTSNIDICHMTCTRCFHFFYSGRHLFSCVCTAYLKKSSMFWGTNLPLHTTIVYSDRNFLTSENVWEMAFKRPTCVFRTRKLLKRLELFLDYTLNKSFWWDEK